MRKLLLFFAMLSVSIGAWADVPSGAVSFGNSSYYVANSDGSYTIHLGAAGDLKSKESDWSWGQAVPWKSANKLIVEADQTVSFATMANKDELYILLQNVEGGKTVDFSNIPESIADDLANNLSATRGQDKVKSIIVPDCYANDVASFVSKAGSYYASTNYYGVSGSSVGAYIQSDSQSDLSNIVAGVDGTVTSVNVSGTAVGENVINAINSLTSLTDATITGKMHAGLNIVVDNDNITSLDFSGIKPADGNTLTINVSGCENLTNINLTDVTVSTVTVSDGYTGTINVTDPNNLGFTLLPEETVQTANIKGPVLPPYTLSASNLTLVNNNTAATANDPGIGDQIYWKVNDTETANAVVTINVNESGTLGDILQQLVDDGYTEKFTKIVLTGELNSTDIESFSNLNTDALDLSGVTLVENRTDGKSILSAARNSYVKDLLLPANSKRDDVKDDEGNVTKIGIVNEITLQGFTALYAAASVETLTSETLGFTAYVKVPGSLQSVEMMLNGWTYINNKNISQTTPSQVNNVLITGNAYTYKLREITISGNINAYDLCGEATLQGGHVVYEPNNGPSEPIHGVAQHGVVTGYTTLGAFNGVQSLVALDLRDASIERVEDFTLSKVNILSQTTTKKLVIPETESVNEIPGDFLYLSQGSFNGIKEICIPSNIEYIRAYAFTGSLDHIWTTPGNASYEDEYTRYDNGAVTTSASGDVTHYGYKDNFDAYTYGTYTFSSNLKLIETSAFANSQPNVKDVFVLAIEAPQCHVDAFSTQMYYGNNGYDSGKINEEGIVTRDAYYNNGKWITMLHYPKQTTAPDIQRYTDPTRDYSIATGEKDGNGSTIYFPNHSEFGYAYAQGTYGYVWNAWNAGRNPNDNTNALGLTPAIGAQGWTQNEQQTANGYYESNTNNPNRTLLTFYNVTDGTALETPDPEPVLSNSVYWSERDYQLADNKVDDSYVQLYDADYRGWHQFVLNGYSANTNRVVVFERSFIKDSEWWTVCLPYDLTRSEMVRMFGDATNNKEPYLSRLLYVKRDMSSGRITLNFSKNLMDCKEIMANDGDVHGKLSGGDAEGTYGIVTVDENTKPGDNDVVLHAGVPYVIKPYLPTEGEGATRLFAFYKDKEEDAQLYDKLHAAQNMSGKEMIELVENGLYTVPALIVNNNNSEKVKSDQTITIDGTAYPVSDAFSYTMVGSFFKNLLPNHCYYLGWKWDDSAKTKGHACFYYKNNTKKSWAWVNNTCIICPNIDSKKVHEAGSTSDPARWIIGGEDASGLDSDDILINSQAAKRTAYDIVYDSEGPDMSTTAIREVSTLNANTTLTDTNVYDLNGRLMSNDIKGLSKGIYIVNGKKMIVK